MTSSLMLIAVVNSISWLLPLPSDQFGWALRARVLNPQTCYLTAESIEDVEMEVVLINYSVKPRNSRPLNSAGFLGELEILMTPPKGKTLMAHHDSHFGQRNAPLLQLPPGQMQSYIFAFKRVGYSILLDPGTYTVTAKLKTAEGMIAAPELKLKFIEPKADAILESRPVALEGYQVNWPRGREDMAAVQQIDMGGHLWLCYRRFYPMEMVARPPRICELPGKALELKVAGAFGDGNPLTITYREHTYSKFTTTHIINSIDGRPWTAEEEKQRQEKLKRDGKLPEKK